MLDFFGRFVRKAKFDRKTLRKNDISILILDERWNKLFANAQPSPGILATEEKLKELLKEQSRLNSELKEITSTKKNCMNRIIQLTPDAFDKNIQAAKTEMQACEKEIRRINERIGEIEKNLEKIPDMIRDKNLELLELTVNQVYFKIRADQKRVKVLEKLIEETRNTLKAFIDEKESLSQDNTDIYSYFHDLLGGEELEKLDREYFKQ